MKTYHVRSVHKIAPRDTDTAECTLPDAALADRKTLGKALRECGVMCAGARIRDMRRDRASIVVFPTLPGFSTYWHAIILTPRGDQ